MLPGVHPRPRGGAELEERLPPPVQGPSPPTRGSRLPRRDPPADPGSIPAHAGEPQESESGTRRAGVHPRPRGGAAGGGWRWSCAEGPSPPTRGSHRRSAHASDARGSIPAHAGEPRAAGGGGRAPRVHPRPRGGAERQTVDPTSKTGPSPPTRGSHARAARRVGGAGSIPAHAGEPSSVGGAGGARWVHPRPRGGAARREDAVVSDPGPSPPTRGSPDALRAVLRAIGSIPAHAGEPHPRVPYQTRARVHPRPRGGAANDMRNAVVRQGPSPPTRGSRVGLDAHGRGRGSIPAHAGEPSTPTKPSSPSRVHPRPRGGAVRGAHGERQHAGPSPPTRGSHRARDRARGHRRSIPAHAGEPPPGRRPSPRRWVHPRPRGGAKARHSALACPRGPSPPTRGSQRIARYTCCQRRSIPAHAGEPPSRPWRATPSRVHPRPRGGAPSSLTWSHTRVGPSPPTRGSPRGTDARRAPLGSIPAHAGEPPSPTPRSTRRRVHPRPRGGAFKRWTVRDWLAGPSPPTRGSRASARRHPAR